MIESALQFLAGLFTPAECKAMVWLIIITLACTHTIKVLWRFCPVRGGSHGQVYLVSAVVALVASYFVWPPIEGQWWTAGIVAGPASNIMFKLALAALKKIWPEGAAAINFERRRGNDLPRIGGSRSGDEQP